MHPNDVEKALAEGVPITCSTCRFFYEGNGFCGKTDCGGPGAGRDFPIYDGPIPRENFADRCLVCGGDSPQYLIVGLETKFALCKKHRKIYNYVGQEDPDKLKHPVRVISLPT